VEALIELFLRLFRFEEWQEVKHFSPVVAVSVPLTTVTTLLLASGFMKQVRAMGRERTTHGVSPVFFGIATVFIFTLLWHGFSNPDGPQMAIVFTAGVLFPLHVAVLASINCYGSGRERGVAGCALILVVIMPFMVSNGPTLLVIWLVVASMVISSFDQPRTMWQRLKRGESNEALSVWFVITQVTAVTSWFAYAVAMRDPLLLFLNGGLAISFALTLYLSQQRPRIA